MNPSRIFHRILAVGDQTGIGVTKVRTAALQAYVKPTSGYLAANETICGEVARFLRLPVPSFGLAHTGVKGQPALFCSLNFNFSNEDLPPVDPKSVVGALPNVAAGIVVLDSLVANTDRHPGNLAMDSRPGQEPRLLIYDHSHALFGPKFGEGVTRLTQLRGRLALNLTGQSGGNRHCLAPLITDAIHIHDWCDRVATIPRWWIRDVVAGAIGITSIEVEAAVDFLWHRSQNLRALFRDNAQQMPQLEHLELL